MNHSGVGRQGVEGFKMLKVSSLFEENAYLTHIFLKNSPLSNFKPQPLGPVSLYVSLFLCEEGGHLDQVKGMIRGVFSLL